MALHRVELSYPESDGDAFGGWLGTWLTNMQPWEAHTGGTVRAWVDTETGGSA